MYKKILNFFHNAYSLFYCANVVFYTFYTIKDNQINYFIFDKIYEYSLCYFTTSIILNLIEKNYMYIVHHSICITNLAIVYVNPDIKFIEWINKCLLAEISTLFLSLSKLLKYYIELTNKKTFINKVKKTSDYLFASSYVVIRLFYLFPFTMIFLYKYEFKSIFLQFLIYTTTLAMLSMNFYWTVKIIERIANK